MFYVAFDLNEGALGSICTAVMGMVGLVMVHETCKPYNKLRAVMVAFICVGFVFCFLAMKDFFTISALLWSDTLILFVFVALAKPVMRQITDIVHGAVKLWRMFVKKPESE